MKFYHPLQYYPTSNNLQEQFEPSEQHNHHEPQQQLKRQKHKNKRQQPRLAKVRAYTSTTQGGRKYMEDEYSIVHYNGTTELKQTHHNSISFSHNNNNSNNNNDNQILKRPFMFFAIFDGHGGEMAAKYSREHLCRNIVRQKEFWSGDHKLVCLAIHRGFVRTQRNMLNEVGEY